MRLVLGLMLVSSLLSARFGRRTRSGLPRGGALAVFFEGIIRVTLPELAKLGFIEGTNFPLQRAAEFQFPSFPP